MKPHPSVNQCTALFTETLAQLTLEQSYPDAIATLTQAIFLWALGERAAAPEQLAGLGGPWAQPAWKGDCPAAIRGLMAQLEALAPSTADLSLSLEALHWQQKTEAERGRGVYYTPPSLAHFMARLALSLYLERLPAPETRLQLLPSATFYDPAVGPGTFLLAALEQLHSLSQRLQLGLKKTDFLPQLAGKDIDPVAVFLAKARLWLQVLPEVKAGAPFPALPGLSVGDSLQEPPFKATVVLANPPYCRQEGIEPAIKDRLWDRFQGRLPRQADLYAYFLADLIHILEPGGVAVVITPVAWLEVDYGLAIQELLLDKLEIPFIIGSACQRWFRKAAVHTAISALTRPAAGVKPTGPTRLINLRVPLEEVPAEELAFSSSCQGRLKFKNQDQWQKVVLPSGRLRALTRKQEPVRASWGSMLRAPAAYFALHEATPGAWTRAGELGTVRRGFTSGANAFFFVRDLSARAGADKLARRLGVRADKDLALIASGTGPEPKYFAIEKEFLAPVVKSPREVRGCLVNREELDWKVLLLPADEDYVSNCKVAAYIRWGESQGFHLRPTLKARPIWWSLPPLPPPQILARQFYHRRFNFPYNPHHILPDHTFYYLTACAAPELVAALLNSTVILFQVELWGRTNMGDGVLTCYGSELADLPVVKPNLLSPEQQWALKKVFRCLSQRQILPLDQELKQPDRKKLDLLVLSALGITGFAASDLLTKIYTEFCQLVDWRQQRSQPSPSN